MNIYSKPKKINYDFIALIAVLFLLMGGLVAKYLTQSVVITPKYRVEPCEVVSSKDNIVTVVDTDGNIWTYYGSAEVGHTFRITFDTQSTPSLKDDAILKVR